MPKGPSSGLNEQALDEDARLLVRLRTGDTEAYDEFVRAHAGSALAVARRILDNEADAADALQDAFLAFFQSLDGFRGDARVSTWLHRIVANAALMKLRSRRRKPERSMDDLLPRYYEDGHRIDPRHAWTTPPDVLLQRRETRRLVLEKISQLPENHRNVLLLRDIQGLSTAATAAQLAESEGAVKTRLHRARQALRRLLEEEFA